MLPSEHLLLSFRSSALLSPHRLVWLNPRRPHPHAEPVALRASLQCLKSASCPESTRGHHRFSFPFGWCLDRDITNGATPDEAIRS